MWEFREINVLLGFAGRAVPSHPIGLPTWQWSRKEIKDGEVKVHSKNNFSREGFVGYCSLSYLVQKKGF